MTDHDADQVIGHLQHYRYADGERRLRLALRSGYEPPDPYVHDKRRTIIEVVVSVPIILALFVGGPFLLWLTWVPKP